MEERTLARTDTYRRQHRQLQKMAVELSRAAVRPGADPKEVATLLRRFVGKLRVHAAMETEALYPSLLTHPDAAVRARATRLHEELGPIYGQVDDFVERWDTPATLGARMVRFRIELARLIGRLGWRMMKEDRQLYPMADAMD